MAATSTTLTPDRHSQEDEYDEDEDDDEEDEESEEESDEESDDDDDDQDMVPVDLGAEENNDEFGQMIYRLMVVGYFVLLPSYFWYRWLYTIEWDVPYRMYYQTTICVAEMFGAVCVMMLAVIRFPQPWAYNQAPPKVRASPRRASRRRARAFCALRPARHSRPARSERPPFRPRTRPPRALIRLRPQPRCSRASSRATTSTSACHATTSPQRSSSPPARPRSRFATSGPRSPSTCSTTAETWRGRRR